MEEADVDFNDPLLLKSKKRRKSGAAAAAAEEQPHKKKKKKTVQGCSAAAAERVRLKAPEFVPRRYQVEVLERVLAENTIVYLETGSGKTFIAVLLLKQLAHKLCDSKGRRFGVFLAPTVFLVIQQADVISSRTDLKVGCYHGEHTESWDYEKWCDELSNQQVLVMTPQILYNVLQLSALRMDMIEVLIFDECHHAYKNHPYASIMKTYYHSLASEVRPKIFGMTASLVATKGATDLMISSLESVLDSKIYTLKNRTELEEKAPTPYHMSIYYNKPHMSFRNLRASLETVLNKHQQDALTSTSKFSDEKEAKKRLRKLLTALYSGIESCLSELGLWSAELAVKLYLKDRSSILTGAPVQNETTDDDLVQENLKNRFLERISEVFKTFMPAEGSCRDLSSSQDAKLAVDEGLITSKIEALLIVLMRYREVDGFRCIVFVERVMVCVVLARLLSQFPCLDFVRTDYMIGVNADACYGNPNRHQEILTSFREGKVNLLVSTSVAEEGLDVQMCNCVVRFDLCRTVRSFIQSRGRARKAGADYVWLLERGNLDHENLLMEMIKSEKQMREEALSRMNNPSQRTPLMDNDIEVFQASCGLCISTAGSVSFIYRYCAQLPGDRYYNPKPDFTTTRCESVNELYKCTITFPPNAPIHFLEGSARRTKDLAKKVACLEACRALDGLGALKKENMKNAIFKDEDKMASRDLAGSGSTKLKELFPSIKSTTFQGTWLTSSTGMNLHVYALTFLADQHDSQGYMNFAFLINRQLDNDVGNIEMNLYTSKTRVVKAKLSSMNQCRLDSTQLAAAKVFQEIMFNGAFSRLVFRDDEKDRTVAKCLLTDEGYAKDLWSQMYLLLPMTDEGSINWDAIWTTAEAAKHLPDLSTVLRRDTLENRSKNCYETTDPGVIRMAGGPVDAAALLDSVVLTVHTGKLFCVTGVLNNLNARSMFQESANSEPCTYESFYIRKHGRLLQFQGQPFLQAKPTHALHNHLLNPNATKKRRVQRQEIVENLVELPPELCLVLGLKSSLVRSLYLLPSFMYRFTAYVIAAELRTKFTNYTPCAPASKIVEALTSLRCQEGFSYEGLELLGDSVLKYAVSRKLFLVFTDKHEGQLSGQRSHAICNATLRKLAVAQGLPSYIRDEPFYPSLWLGAGMYRLRKRKCLCRLDSLVTEASTRPKPSKHSFYIGKTCGEGHRWMCSKTTSDVVEALIGAYTVGGGFYGALEFMKALEMDVDFDNSLIALSQQCSSVPSEAIQHHMVTLNSLEKQISYSFKNKSLLLQAITHASVPDAEFCYQRLEFLGDAALDLLVTEHLFKSHPGLSPGLLSDLRSAAVNNDCFARVAVKHGLHTYLRHDSGVMQAEVTNFLNMLNKRSLSEDSSFGFNSLSGPKVLGDLVESIAGAILVDSGFDLERLWTVMEPLLSPLVTPATLSFHPVRECLELCTLKEFDWKWDLSKKHSTVGIQVQAGEATYIENSQKKKKKDAKKEAAEKMLATLKVHGHRHPRWDSAVTKERLQTAVERAGEAALIQVPVESFYVAESKKDEQKPQIGYTSVQPCSSANPSMQIVAASASRDSSMQIVAASASIDEEKPPRMILHELCTQRKWEKPNYEEGEKLGSGHKRWFSFTVSMEIPGVGCLEQVSNLMANKKRAMDDAAQKMVAQLKSLGILTAF